jgi:hypothetical protein
LRIRDRLIKIGWFKFLFSIFNEQKYNTVSKYKSSDLDQTKMKC